MPLDKDHKRRTRAQIVEAARILFNRHGFHKVSIDMVMREAGLTRGGFYNHFKNKSELFAESVRSFLTGRGAQWRNDAGIDITNLNPNMARQMIDSYLSIDHLNDLDGQCPMIALPSDVGRSDNTVREAYQELVISMVWLFEESLRDEVKERRQCAMTIAAQCVGAMVLGRTLTNPELVDELLAATRSSTEKLLRSETSSA